jgi:hypothetical protein
MSVATCGVGFPAANPRISLRKSGLRRYYDAAARTVSHHGGARRSRTNIPQPRAAFHKRKAAGWGPGGSRTSAIVSGGWECDRRR